MIIDHLTLSFFSETTQHVNVSVTIEITWIFNEASLIDL